MHTQQVKARPRAISACMPKVAQCSQLQDSRACTDAAWLIGCLQLKAASSVRAQCAHTTSPEQMRRAETHACTKHAATRSRGAVQPRRPRLPWPAAVGCFSPRAVANTRQPHKCGNTPALTHPPITLQARAQFDRQPAPPSPPPPPPPPCRPQGHDMVHTLLTDWTGWNSAAKGQHCCVQEQLKRHAAGTDMPDAHAPQTHTTAHSPLGARRGPPCAAPRKCTATQPGLQQSQRQGANP